MARRARERTQAYSGAHNISHEQRRDRAAKRRTALVHADSNNSNTVSCTKPTVRDLGARAWGNIRSCPNRIPLRQSSARMPS